MGRARTRAQHMDRAFNTITGETGTIIDVHDGTKKKGQAAQHPRYGVLPDGGKRSLVVWRGEECEWEPPSGKRKCHRCGSTKHTVINCPEGDL